MPNFKPKANKKIKVKKNANVTLDSKHNEKMTEFTNITEKRQFNPTILEFISSKSFEADFQSL